MQGLPARECELQRRRAAWLALKLERATDHPHALADPDEPEAASLCRLRERSLDLEAHAVVDDLELDRAAARTYADGDVRRARMLAHVGECFLDGAEHGDPLR